MKKINRREYLKGLGAAGAIATAGIRLIGKEPDFTRESLPGSMAPTSTREVIAREAPLTESDPWPPVYDKPKRDELVTLVFGGLMGFFYNDKGRTCDIGFHPGDGMHKPQIQIYEIVGKDCREIFNISPLPEEVQRITLGAYRKN